jgi:hypothetical protein
MLMRSAKEEYPVRSSGILLDIEDANRTSLATDSTDITIKTETIMRTSSDTYHSALVLEACPAIALPSQKK